MKFLIKLAIGILIGLFLLLCLIYVFLIIGGKAYFIKKLENVTHKKVTIQTLDVTPPLRLHIRKLEVEGLVKVEYISVAPSLARLLIANIAFNEIKIVNPEITIRRPLEKKEATPPGEIVVSAPVPVAPVIGQENEQQEIIKKHLPFLIFKNIIVKNGKVNFYDPNAGTSGIKLGVKDINLRITNLYLMPVSVVTNFKLSGKIPWGAGNEEGTISFEGWANLRKKNIEAALRVEKIDGVYLYPYYSNWVDLEKARIEKAKLNFTSDICGINNNLTAQCHLELTDIVRRPRAPEEPQEKAERIADAVLGIFKAMDQGKIVLDFTIRTKMDKPVFGFGDIRNAVESKINGGRKSGISAQGFAMLPAKLVEGTVKGATDFSKALIVGTYDVGEEIFKSVRDAFKIRKKK